MATIRRAIGHPICNKLAAAGAPSASGQGTWRIAVPAIQDGPLIARRFRCPSKSPCVRRRTVSIGYRELRVVPIRAMATLKQTKGKRSVSRRSNLLPLLPSGPDGVQRELAARDLPFEPRCTEGRGQGSGFLAGRETGSGLSLCMANYGREKGSADFVASLTWCPRHRRQWRSGLHAGPHRPQWWRPEVRSGSLHPACDWPE